jgi:hypothetical protein
MKHGLAVLALALVTTAHAAEPPAPRAAATPVPATAPKPAEPPAPRKPLDLRIGNIRNYMMPKDYLEAITRPDADQETVVVEGKRESAPMKRVEDVPPGLMSLGYAVTNPLNAWRIFAPVVDARAAEPPSVVPPPVFRWGP